MLHSQIENEEIVERYVQNQLAPEARQAFEEHFFACEECFEKLQATERFLAGVRDAADRGLLNHKSRAAFASGQGKRFLWAFAASACTALAFATIAGRMYLSQMPKLQGELNRTAAQLQVQQRMLAQLEQRISSAEQPEANVPLVMLQASRGEEPASALLPPGARRLVVWVELGPTRYRRFRMEVFSQQDLLITSLEHLQRGPYGALAAAFPVERLQPGDFRIKLTGQDPLPASLVGEYKLRIRRP